MPASYMSETPIELTGLRELVAAYEKLTAEQREAARAIVRKAAMEAIRGT